MATVSVVVAWRDMGDPHRRAAWEYVYAWWQRFGWEIVVEAGSDDATFSRAAAINAGVRRATGDVIVQTDPDSLIPDNQRIHDAIAAAADAPGLVVPHDRYLYLAEATTAQVLAGRDPATVGSADCESYGGGGVGNVVVFSRATWLAARGFDERFGVWGGDDAAFAYAAEAFCGPVRRLSGDMVHLWHPRLPQSEPGHPGYARQFAILAAYRDAATRGPEHVKRLVLAR